jgi:hypothetical protein
VGASVGCVTVKWERGVGRCEGQGGYLAFHMSRVDDPLVKAGFNWRWVFPLDRLLVFFTGGLP